MDLQTLALVQKAVKDAHVDHIGPQGDKGAKVIHLLTKVLPLNSLLLWSDLKGLQALMVKLLKRVDYQIEEDKQEIVQLVLEVLQQ